MKQDEGKIRYKRAVQRMNEIRQNSPTNKKHLFQKADDKRPPEGYEVITFGGDFVAL